MTDNLRPNTVSINITYQPSNLDLLSDLLKNFAAFIDEMEEVGCDVTMSINGTTYATPQPDDKEGNHDPE
jgi:hypothetical protein